MSKFKVGDKVRVLATCTGCIIKPGDELTVSAVGRTDHKKRPAIKVSGHTDFMTHNYPYAEEFFELVNPDRLFRKGDKINLTVEVAKDQCIDLVFVRFPSGRSAFFSAKNLRDGTKVTYAPEPPFAPKPGDRFKLFPDVATAYTCLWIDGEHILYEDKNGRRSLRQRGHALFRADD